MRLLYTPKGATVSRRRSRSMALERMRKKLRAQNANRMAHRSQRQG